MALSESPDAQDARVEALWKKLDPHGKGEIDLNGLQRGLRKIDHPLKNAHDMLKDVVRAMDKNGDEVIQYEGKSEQYHGRSALSGLGVGLSMVLTGDV